MTFGRDHRCHRCARLIPAGTQARWDAVAERSLCTSCHQADLAPPTNSGPAPIGVDPSAVSAPSVEFWSGVADRRRHPDAHDLGDEMRFGAMLDVGLSDAVVLHDRHKRGRKALIDHIVVASSGVWVIDTKGWPGVVERRNLDASDERDQCLFVGGHDRSRDVDGLCWQTEAVLRAIEPLDFDVPPIRPMLSFPNADWQLIDRPFEMCGVIICRPSDVVTLIKGATQVIGLVQMQSIVGELEARLVAAQHTAAGFAR